MRSGEFGERKDKRVSAFVPRVMAASAVQVRRKHSEHQVGLDLEDYTPP